jgi:hypothetical protein
MSCHQVMQNPTFTNELMQWLGKANEHCSGTLNEFHLVSLLAVVGSNEVFTYHQGQTQDEWSHFTEMMEKKIKDHEG